MGKGCYALPYIARLLSDVENWFPIRSSKDYHFPGVFETKSLQRLGYCENITMLTNYTEKKQDFLYYDIQLGKEKGMSKRTIELEVAGKKEAIVYRIAPCKGVKYCGRHSQGCDYVTSTRENRQHPDEKLVPSQELAHCPVEFVYVRPQDDSDNRRWIGGIVRGDNSTECNLRTHKLHSSKHIPCRVKEDIAHAAISNPHLKTRT